MTTPEALIDIDRYDPRIAARAAGALRAFNDAGVLSVADVHIALRLGRLGAVNDEAVLLAAALAARAPRLGHVCVDLGAIHATATSDLDVAVDVAALPWPAPRSWVAQVAASPLVGDGRPLRLDDTTLYVDRYWTQEHHVASDLLQRAEHPPPSIDTDALTEGLDRLFLSGDEPDLQRLAAASAVLRWFSVIAGGPGTGKTTTIARVLALLDDQDTTIGRRPALVGLAAPTGKAAARLEEAVHAEAATLPISDRTRARLLSLRGMTLHRLLGWNPGNRTRFRHHRLNHLAHDVVVVDETSMVSLSLMARLVEAVRRDARLILVGDPEQLASVEAGAVLGDLVGPANTGLRMRGPAREALHLATGQPVPAVDPSPSTPIGDGIVVLRRVHRFGGDVGRLAASLQAGDADGALEVLRNDCDDVRWLQTSDGDDSIEHLHEVRTAAVEAGRHVIDAARHGLAADALNGLGAFRVLCAHRRGPNGATTWMAHVQRWLAAEVEGFASDGVWYAGRPLLVTANDYSLRLYNGDTGVVVTKALGRAVAVFERGGQIIEVSPTRLASVDTVYAMTIHKSQGSQFDTVAVVLPEPDSPILTRELLYTAVTRARQRVVLVGTEAAIRVAAARPIARSSGLGRRLWG
jgi:exodeoxyribonuclease V alpha subunit